MKMTKEEKELLLKEICTRLPYGVKVQIDFGEHCIKYGIDRYVDDTVICVYPETFEVGVNDEDQACDIEDVKPYLRPMYSMTGEEREYIKNRWCYEDWYDIHDFLNHYQIDAGDTFDFVDWLNEHCFDYRGLIEKGLALQAPEGMYKFSDNTIGNE